MTGLPAESERGIFINPLPGRRVTAQDFTRTPFGAFPAGLLHQFGVFDEFVHLVARTAPARCERCSVDVPRRDPSAQNSFLTEAQINRAKDESGFFVVVAPATDEIELREYLELLGATRAVVGGRLISVDDLGEKNVASSVSSLPVLLIAHHHECEALSARIKEWFSRGGDTATIFYFSSRLALGEELASISKQDRCPQCREECEHFDPIRTMREDECRRCKGGGYFDTAGIYGVQTLQCCPDCNGSGSAATFPDIHFLDHPISKIPTVSFRELLPLFQDSEGSTPNTREEYAALYSVIKTVTNSPLANYAIGTPIISLSIGERVVVTTLQAELSHYSGEPLIVSSRYLGVESEDFIKYMSDVSARNAAIVFKREADIARSEPIADNKTPAPVMCSVSMLSDISPGLSSFSFPFGEVTAVLGGISGVAKDLLYEGIYKRFAKRKKLAAVCDYAGCTDAHYLALPDPLPQTLGELLGVLPEIAKLYASTATAAKLGITTQDISRSLESSKPESESSFEDAAPPVTNWQHGLLTVNEVSLNDALSIPIAELVNSIIFDDAVDNLVRTLLPLFPASISLGAKVAELPWDVVVEAFYRAGIILAVGPSLVSKSGVYSKARVTKGRGKSSRPLIVIENPFRCSQVGCECIADEIARAAELGATVVCSATTTKFILLRKSIAYL